PSAEFSSAQLLSQAQQLCGNMHDGGIKMYVTHKALSVRNQMPAVFRDGDYTALKAQGAQADHVLAFTRSSSDRRLVVIVPRLCARLGGNLRLPTGQEVWRDTAIQLPKWESSVLHNVFTGENVLISERDHGCELEIASALNSFPVAVLTLG
ncbi:MAG TPA: hypothetical protein VGL74_08545, partial [Terriglobales bacterium]